MRFGYARTSKDMQQRALQLDALQREGVEQIVEESGTGMETRGRPKIESLLDNLRQGDVLVVWKLDRLGRPLRQLIDMMEGIHARGAHFVSITERIDTTTPIGELFFHIIGAIAQYERALMHERTMAGLAASRSRGRFGGRPPLSTATRKAIKAVYRDKKLNVQKFCAEHEITRSTFYKYAKLFAGDEVVDLGKGKKTVPGIRPAPSSKATKAVSTSKARAPKTSQKEVSHAARR